MLKFTMDLRNANTGKTSSLATILIANVGHSYVENCCDYIYVIYEPKPLYGLPIKTMGKLINYDRRNSCVAILSRVLKQYEQKISYEDLLTSYDKTILAKMTEEAEQCITY